MRSAEERQTGDLLRRAFECSADAMGLVVLEPSGCGRLLWANAALATITAYSLERLSTMAVTDLAEPDDVDAWQHLLSRSSTAGERACRAELRCRRADGSRLSVDVTCSPITGDTGSITHAVIRLQELAGGPTAEILPEGAHDALTGVLTREGLERRIKERFIRRSRESARGALLFCDVDGLKNVNDRSGHLAGDAVIRATAARLVACVRPEDLVARFGGDEFVVVAWALAGPAVDSLVRQICSRVAEPIHHDGSVLRVTTSIGVAMLDPLTTSVEAALGRADAQMYAVKRHRVSRDHKERN